MTVNSEKIALYVGAAISVLLLILYLKNQGGGQTTVNPTYEVSAGSPEMAQIGANVRIAQIGAQTEIAKDYLGFVLGSQQSTDQTGLGKYQTDAAVSINTANNSLSQILGLGALDVQRNADNLNHTLQSQQTEAARQLGTQTLKNQDKASSRSAWGNAFSSISKSVLGIFGL